MAEYNGRYIPDWLRIDTQPVRNSHKAVRVYQYDLHMNLVNVYETIAEAARENGITKRLITYAMEKKWKSHGFFWRKEGDND